MTDWSNGLRQAIFDILVADATLRTTLGASVAEPRVFSDVPDKQPFPYIEIADEDEDRWATHDKSGGEVSMPIVVWTREASWVKSNAIRTDVLRLLGDPTTDLVVAGFNVLGGYFEGGSKIKGPAENMKQQVLEIRYNVLEN